jgi:hypothetical protein
MEAVGVNVQPLEILEATSRQHSVLPSRGLSATAHIAQQHVAVPCHLGFISHQRRMSVNLLDLPLLVVLHRVVKQLRVDLHKQLQCIIHHPMNSPNET